MGERGGGDERGVLDAHAVVDFVAFLKPAQDGDGVLDARLIDHDGLEAALERGVLLDVFAVLVERGRADGAQFAARELRLEQLPASIAPSALPAPTMVCSSSMKRMILPSLAVTSLRNALSRSSNSPRNFAPAIIAPRSMAMSVLFLSESGTSPLDDAAREAFDDGGLARRRARR